VLAALGERYGAVRDAERRRRGAADDERMPMALIPCSWRSLAAPSPETVFDRRVEAEKRLSRRTGGVQESNQQPPKTLQHHLERGRGWQQIFNGAMKQRSAIEELLARARASLDGVEPSTLPMRWQPARSQSIFAPVNNDSETASYPAPSSSTAMSSSGGSTLPLLISYPLQPTPTFVTSWCATMGTARGLAAATLRELGLNRATDLVGGFQALLAMLRRTNARPTNAGAARTHSQPMLSPMSTYSVLPPEVGISAPTK
jgi:hypothetical protein